MEQKFFLPRQTLGQAIVQAKDEYLKTYKTKGTGDWRLWHKAIVLFSLFFFLYYLLVFSNASLFWKGAGCVGLSIVIASIGFCVMHDANHGAFSQKRWVNRLMSFSLNFLGAISYFWRQKHNIDHHTYTNIEGMDHDVDAPLLRMHPAKKWYWYHRFQFLYCWVMYSVLYLAWVFLNDFQKYFSYSATDIRNKKTKEKRLMPLEEHFIFWGTKLWYVFLFIYLPWSQVGWEHFWRGYLIVMFGTGLLISVVFQIAHVVQKTLQVSTTHLVANKEEWMAHQLATTADFGTKSRILSWWLGGLGFQVEHHLFPKISHIHYKELHKRIKAVCDSFGKGIHKEYSTFSAGIADHAVYMFKLGWDKRLR